MAKLQRPQAQEEQGSKLNDAVGLLDSRVVDVLLVYNLAFAMLSALKLLFFKSLKNALRVSENTEA